ncbi:MAG: hypothetical protein D6798_05505 [Deltaproteobacteria bacterium]|nr:MAG: hypothetical protein D6798_05505 [Deltaproteobacteria bacterium]
MPLFLLLAAGCLSTSGIVLEIDDGDIVPADDDAGRLAMADAGLDGSEWFATGDTGLADGGGDRLLWAWTDGTDRDDRPTAIAMADDGRVLVGGYLGAAPGGDVEQTAELISLWPDGSTQWRTVLATAGASLVIDEIHPTADGGAWVCATDRTSATLAPTPGDVPESWSRVLTAIRVDTSGRVGAVTRLSVTEGGELAAGCGRDAAGALVIDGSLRSGELQLVADGVPVTLTDFGQHGFVVSLDDDGGLRSASTWRTGSQRRQAGAVRPDGSVVQLLRYAGDPGIGAGGRFLTPCPGSEVCTGLLVVDPEGLPTWTATLGPGVGADAHLASTADGGLLLAADIGESTQLPQADGDPVVDRAGGSIIAAWSPDLVLDWLVHLSEEAQITALHPTPDGPVWVGLWTDDAATLQVGDGEIPVDDSGATIALARIDGDGHTDWMWSAAGGGTAWPTALAGTRETAAIAAVYRGAVVAALGGDEVRLDSLSTDSGLSTNDIAVVLLDAGD